MKQALPKPKDSLWSALCEFGRTILEINPIKCIHIRLECEDRDIEIDLKGLRHKK